jgi:hypothetical protein
VCRPQEMFDIRLVTFYFVTPHVRFTVKVSKSSVAFSIGTPTPVVWRPTTIASMRIANYRRPLDTEPPFRQDYADRSVLFYDNDGEVTILDLKPKYHIEGFDQNPAMNREMSFGFNEGLEMKRRTLIRSAFRGLGTEQQRIKMTYANATQGMPMIRYDTSSRPGPAMAAYIAGWLASALCQLARDDVDRMEQFVLDELRPAGVVGAGGW